MKPTIILLIVIAMTSTSFTVNNTPKYITHADAVQMATQVIAAFQHTSSQEFTALLPSLQEFHQLMDMNASLYGDFLKDAKAEFENNYEHELLPSTKKSFNEIIQEGKNRGIDWSNIEFVKIEAPHMPEQTFSIAPVTIVFSFKQKKYSLKIEKALCINHTWRASQFMELI